MNSLHVSTPPLSAPADDFTGGGSNTSGTMAQARSVVAGAARQIKSAAADTAARARDEAQRIAAEKKDTAARRIGGYSSALRDSAKSLEGQDPNIAWFTHRVADRVQGVADYVRERDFDELRGDAEDFARRNPAIFFGGLFLAGLLLGNVVKASRRSLERDDDDDEMGQLPEPESASDPMRDAEARVETPNEELPTSAPSAMSEEDSHE